MGALWPGVVVALGLGAMFVFHRSLTDWFAFRRELKLADTQHAELSGRIATLNRSMLELSEELNRRLVRIENKSGLAR